MLTTTDLTLCSILLVLVATVIRCVISSSTILPIHNVSSLEFRQIANETYVKVIPCLERAWMLKTRHHKINWSFPEDAHDHYLKILRLTKPFRRIQVHEYAGYNGPWLENIFITKFKDFPLYKFNGFIPIFIQWIDSQILRGRLFDNILMTLSTVLRPNVIYLAVSQGDVGLGKIGKEFPNILVLSAGGYGHIALPLIKGDLEIIPPPSRFIYDLGFYGNPVTPPRNLILPEINHLIHRFNVSYYQYQGDDWLSEMQHTRFNLAPRGYGRNSFRFTESIQMGRIPVLIYDDIPWTPYQRTNLSLLTFGFMARHFDRHNTLPQLVRTIKNITHDQYMERYEHMLSVREHYTYRGLMRQIAMFIADPFNNTGANSSQLTCTYHPTTERCCG